MTTKTILFVVGALAEFGGILLIAAPDLIPGARRLGRWSDRKWRPFENRLRRALGLPGRQGTVTASARLSAAVAMDVIGIVGVAEDATLEEKVEFLLRRDAETQRETQALTKRIATAEDGAARREGDLRDEFRRYVDAELRSAFAADRVLRVLGSVLLALGLACVTVASFL